MGANNTPSATVAPKSTPPPLGENLRAGLALLRQAYAYAQDAGADLRDFALEINELYETGLMISDLRWLVAKRLAEHARETTVYGDPHRSFRPSVGFNFETTTCLVLTPSGAELADHVSREFAVPPPSTSSVDTASVAGGEKAALQTDASAAGETDGPQVVLKPHWNEQRRELWLADTIVKRFRVPARNQQTILSAFEEEDWPEHIDDPLPVSGDVDPGTRLHHTIYRLNNRQTNDLLRFHGNGNADGVLWKLRDSELPQKAREGTRTDVKLG